MKATPTSPVTTKKNVSVYNQDVATQGGYPYTVNPSFSSWASCKRSTDEALKKIRSLNIPLKKIVDAGCGDGTFTEQLAQALPDIEFLGFDPASEAIAAAKARSVRAKFQVGNLLEPSTLPSGTYDLVLLLGVLHHLTDQKQAVANALKISPRVLIIEPNGNNPILKVIEKTSKYHIEHEEQSFSSRFFFKMAHELKLKVLSSCFIGFVPIFFPTLPAKVIYFFQPFLEKIPFLARFLGAQIVLLLEKEGTPEVLSSPS